MKKLLAIAMVLFGYKGLKKITKPAYEEIFTDVGIAYRELKISEMARLDRDGRDNPKLYEHNFLNEATAAKVIVENQDLFFSYGLSIVTDGKFGFLTLDRSAGYGILPAAFTPMTCFFNNPEGVEEVITNFKNPDSGQVIVLAQTEGEVFDYLNKHYSNKA